MNPKKVIDKIHAVNGIHGIIPASGSNNIHDHAGNPFKSENFPEITSYTKINKYDKSWK